MAEGKDQRTQAVPAYVVRYMGRRVSWGKREAGQRGRVTSCQQVSGEEGPWVSLRVLTDTGFLAVGVNGESVQVEDDES